MLGAFLARFSLSESSLSSLLSLDNTLKPAWINIMVRDRVRIKMALSSHSVNFQEQSKGVEVSS